VKAGSGCVFTDIEMSAKPGNAGGFPVHMFRNTEMKEIFCHRLGESRSASG